MSDEAAFLEVLKANPADDTARLVYADWLDEHDESLKAEYLRLTHAYVTEEEGELVPVGRILALGEQVPEDWRVAAAGRFDLIVYTNGEPGGKLLMIKAVRELNGCGLAELKWFVEDLPRPVFGWLPLDTALACHSMLAGKVPGADARVVPSELQTVPCPLAFQLRASMWTWNQNARIDPNTRQRAQDMFAAFLGAAREPGDTVQEEGPDSTPTLISAPLHATALVRRLRTVRRLADEHTGEGWHIYVSGQPLP